MSNKFLKFLFIPHYMTALIILMIMRLLSSFYLIRLFPINSNRIGHFIGNTEVYLTRKKAKMDKPSKPYIDICYYEIDFKAQDKICNYQFDKMLRRVIKIYPSFPFYYLRKLISKLENNFPKVAEHILVIRDGDKDLNNLFSKYDSSFKFTEKEMEQGNNILRKIGVKKNAEFVCLAVRDSAYLEKSFKDFDSTYHSYRDCKIEDFILASETLAQMGYYVLRVGKVVNSYLDTKNPKIIDYSNSDYRSDFMDIFIGANCKFVITTQLGFDAIPYVFRKPAAAISIPIGLIRSFKKDNLSITKHHYDHKTKKNLSITEIFDKGLGFALKSDDFTSKNVTLIDNTPEEIRDLVIEMINELNKSKTEQFSPTKLQQNFNNLLKEKEINNRKKDLFPRHNISNIKGTMSNSFLRNKIKLI